MRAAKWSAGCGNTRTFPPVSIQSSLRFLGEDALIDQESSKVSRRGA